MTPKKKTPAVIFQRTPRKFPRADEKEEQIKGNGSPITPSTQYTILTRPKPSPPGQTAEVAGSNRQENESVRISRPRLAFVPTTRREDANENSTGTTDHNFFWKCFAGPTGDPYLVVNQTKARNHLGRRGVKFDDKELQEVMEYLQDLEKEESWIKFLEKHKMSFDKDLGQLVDPESHHTVQGKGDLIQVPPQYITETDILDDSGEATTTIKSHDPLSNSFKSLRL